MRYTADHDFHIHTTVSPCCHDENQTPERLLKYAVDNGFSEVCITNHLWDRRVKSVDEWHPMQTFESLESVLPLPQSGGARLLFGAEVDMDYNNTIGISPERYDSFDFFIVSTTHLHLDGYTVRQRLQTPEEAARIWLERFEALLNKENMPWKKMGIAHLTCNHVFEKRTREVIRLLPDGDLYDLFGESSKKGLGIELNMKTISMTDEDREIFLRPYFIAKEQGCKFYLGSDSHKVVALEDSKKNFESVIDALSLKESDKFIL